MEFLQDREDLRAVSGSVFGFFLDAVSDEFNQGLRRIESGSRLNLGHRCVDLFIHDFHGVGAIVGHVTTDQFEHHDAEGVDISAGCDALKPHGLFWRHIVRSSEGDASLGELLLRALQAGEAEVEDLRDLFAVLIVDEEDILGLEIAVDDAALVGLSQGAGDASRDIDDALERELAAHLLGDGEPIKVLHRHVEDAGVFIDAAVEEHDDISVIHPGDGFGLTQEAIADDRVGHVVVFEDLKGNSSPDGFLDGPVDIGHTALTMDLHRHELAPDCLAEEVVVWSISQRHFIDKNKTIYWALSPSLARATTFRTGCHDPSLAYARPQSAHRFQAGTESQTASPHFSQSFSCVLGSEGVYFVALALGYRRIVRAPASSMLCAPCIHQHLHPLATKSREKCGLAEHMISVDMAQPEGVEAVRRGRDAVKRRAMSPRPGEAEQMSRETPRAAAYAGSFDPPTRGHLKLIQRGACLFDTLYVAIGVNAQKHRTFSLEERIQMLKESIEAPNVIVTAFDGLLVDFCKSHEIKVILRGLRAVTDFEYEFQMGMANMNLEPEIETLFLLTDPETLFISSSIVKEIAKGGRDVSRYVPPLVAERLRSRSS